MAIFKENQALLALKRSFTDQESNFQSSSATDLVENSTAVESKDIKFKKHKNTLPASNTLAPQKQQATIPKQVANKRVFEKFNRTEYSFFTKTKRKVFWTNKVDPDNKLLPLCDCPECEEITNKTSQYCSGFKCSCQHDNVHRIRHTVFTGKVNIIDKGYGFVEANNTSYFIPQTEALKVLNNSIISFTVYKNPKSTGSNFVNIKQVLSHPYTKSLAKVVSIKPLHVIPYLEQRSIAFPAFWAEECIDKITLQVGDIVQVDLEDANYNFANPHAERSKPLTFKVTKYLASHNDKFIKWYNALAKLDLPFKDDNKTLAVEDQFKTTRTDLSCIPFISVDNDDTTDIDDAVYLHYINDKDLIIDTKPSDTLELFTDSSSNIITRKLQLLNSQKLILTMPYNTTKVLAVAIAEPRSLYQKDSIVEQRARLLTSSFYLPAYTLSMLPTSVVEASSLNERKIRPSIITYLFLDKNDTVIGIDFVLAQICNHAKLTYMELNSICEGEEIDLGGHLLEAQKIKQLMQNLFSFYQNRLAIRKKEERTILNAMQNTQYIIDQSGKCIDIYQEPTSTANNIIGECMILLNSCTAQYFVNRDITGIFNTQAGIKDKYLNNFKSLLRYLYTSNTIPELEDYYKKYIDSQEVVSVDIFHKIKEIVANKSIRLAEKLLVVMLATNIDVKPGVHFGLGENAYLNISSPIRRYTDIINQIQLRNYLESKQTELEEDHSSLIDHLNNMRNLIRNTTRELTLNLITDYLSSNTKRIYKVSIQQFSQAGITIREQRSGIIGTLDFKQLNNIMGGELLITEPRYSYESEKINLYLNQELEVQYSRISNGRPVFVLTDETINLLLTN